MRFSDRDGNYLESASNLDVVTSAPDVNITAS